jgi:hypothetical protein
LCRDEECRVPFEVVDVVVVVVVVPVLPVAPVLPVVVEYEPGSPLPPPHAYATPAPTPSDRTDAATATVLR